jgi:hypothetical protein
LTSSDTDASGLPGITVLAGSATICSRPSIDSSQGEPAQALQRVGGVLGFGVLAAGHWAASGLLIPGSG